MTSHPLTASHAPQAQADHVEDLAQLAVDAAQTDDDVELVAVGPEGFTYAEMVKLVRDKTGSRCWVVPAPKALAYVAGRVLGRFLNDIVLTRDEIKGLSRGLLVSRSKQPAPTRLTEWLHENAHHLGNSYANEVQRHYG